MSERVVPIPLPPEEPVRFIVQTGPLPWRARLAILMGSRISVSGGAQREALSVNISIQRGAFGTPSWTQGWVSSWMAYFDLGPEEPR